MCDVNQIKQNAWLKGVNWKQVEEKKLNVPLQPDLYRTYIVEEFQEKQVEADNMNKWEN